jgi:hypothetical protein
MTETLDAFRYRLFCHLNSTIVLKAAESTRSPDFGGENGLRVAFAVLRLVLELIPLDRQVFRRCKTHL